MLADRFAGFLHRNRRILLSIWIVHALLLHWIVIGFVSWDGLAYRVPPVVEFAQHGSFGLEKYNQWAFLGYVPFIELVHIPFVYLFKLPGILIGFPLVVFPLCVVAVHAFLRELSREARCATFGSLAYVAIPMVNQQPYSGYVDFAVCALLALYLYTVLRIRTAKSKLFAFTSITGASMLFTMSRIQGIYVVGMILPVLCWALFVERSGVRLRITRGKQLGIAIGATLVGGIPSLAIQLMKYVRFGTPTYPFQFQLLGFKIGTGVTTKTLFFYAGLRDDSPREFLSAFVGGWIWPRAWPLGGFFDSRNMGGGFVLVVALALLVVFVRSATQMELLLVGVCLLVSLAARDFFLPRYAYTLIIAIAVVIGRAMGHLSVTRRAQPLYWGSAVALLAHMLRPEFDVALLDVNVGMRLNVTRSAHFPPGPNVLEMFPDLGRKLVIVDYNWNGFVLPLYGTSLTNEVVATVPKTDLGDRCSGLAPFVERDPEVLIIDDLNHTRDCTRICAVTAEHGECRAYRITAPTSGGS